MKFTSFCYSLFILIFSLSLCNIAVADGDERPTVAPRKIDNSNRDTVLKLLRTPKEIKKMELTEEELKALLVIFTKKLEALESAKPNAPSRSMITLARLSQYTAGIILSLIVSHIIPHTHKIEFLKLISKFDIRIDIADLVKLIRHEINCRVYGKNEGKKNLNWGRPFKGYWILTPAQDAPQLLLRLSQLLPTNAFESLRSLL